MAENVEFASSVLLPAPPITTRTLVAKAHASHSPPSNVPLTERITLPKVEQPSYHRWSSQKTKDQVVENYNKCLNFKAVDPRL